jgi:hypothetical protein
LMVLLLSLTEVRPRPLNSQRTLKTVLFAVVVFLSGGWISDFVTATAIARQFRGDLPPSAMIEETVRTFFDTTRIDTYRQREEIRGLTDLFGEYYLANPIWARFVETKFHDNAFFWTTDLSPQQTTAIQQVTVDRFYAVLPDPFLRFFALDVDKAVTEFSMGDYFIYLRSGRPLGGFVTGSMLAHGEVVAPDFFPLIYFVICIVLFLVWESLTFLEKTSGRRLISVLVMLAAWPLFIYGITAESLNHMFNSLIRTLPQNMLLYLILYHITAIGFTPHFRIQRTDTNQYKM